MNEPLSIFAQPSACMILQLLMTLPLAAGLLLFLIPDKIPHCKRDTCTGCQPGDRIPFRFTLFSSLTNDDAGRDNQKRLHDPL